MGDGLSSNGEAHSGSHAGSRETPFLPVLQPKNLRLNRWGKLSLTIKRDNRTWVKDPSRNAYAGIFEQRFPLPAVSDYLYVGRAVDADQPPAATIQASVYGHCYRGASDRRVCLPDLYPPRYAGIESSLGLAILLLGAAMMPKHSNSRRSVVNFIERIVLWLPVGEWLAWQS